MTVSDLDEILTTMSHSSRNSALEAAAKVAALYGASDEVCIKILQLRAPLKREKSDAQT